MPATRAHLFGISFNEYGTQRPVRVYADPELHTALAQPVHCDNRGAFPVLYVAATAGDCEAWVHSLELGAMAKFSPLTEPTLTWPFTSAFTLHCEFERAADYVAMRWSTRGGAGLPPALARKPAVLWWRVKRLLGLTKEKPGARPG